MKRADGNPITMLLVAGGTGGHILPAIAFGDWLREAHPDVNVAFMSGSRSIELEIYRAFEIEPYTVGVSGSPLGVPGVRMIKRWAELFFGFFQAVRFLKKMSPDICVLFGGYVSMPALLAGKLSGLRSVIHEQNARAGRVTRAAAMMNIPVAAGWSDCEPLKDGSYANVGVPVRRFEKMNRKEAWEALGVEDEKTGGPTVAVMTGSLGSGKLAEALLELTKMELFSSWRFFVVDPSADSVRKASVNVTLLPRMWDITPLYVVSDLLVTRGGASTLSEVRALDMPAVVAPWRGALDDHQMKNARAASCSKILIWNEDESSLTDLADKLQKLYAIFGDKNSNIGNMLYNASMYGEKICRRLMDFAVGSRKGEVDFGG
ncbi:MAG: UDP-N-acetylglucosamine--N-acetylmuramyl-(pentapeptide) pyrophosphoryl-undecaprenol N-acetylglucosamine transferase [Synergistaceae bacterium]|jgi:UDP-N-acetylglucosamine--N-acetylmuramyl-(pentapeptide) pyrophosphoryl-undecaprenol N-acetylglucosamine transferase|nr:UDP-N-acetylglucosamine--N-acetylmuramyl-(pentapeptide) pyrophosphoryl-undecaprenol N-acetylglucosamine transferase [Synergistaceae bacterium]